VRLQSQRLAHWCTLLAHLGLRSIAPVAGRKHVDLQAAYAALSACQHLVSVNMKGTDLGAVGAAHTALCTLKLCLNNADEEDCAVLRGLVPCLTVWPDEDDNE